MQKPEAFDTRLVGSRLLTPYVRQLVFERADGNLEFDPGQWVNLVLPLPDQEIKRAYSIASPPDGSPRFEVAVTRVDGGPGSELLHALPEGATLRAIGPQGCFTRSPADRTPALFVATGTGVTPLRSMIHAAMRAGSRVPMWLLFGARHEEDILYADELEALERSGTGLRYVVTLSKPKEAWEGRRGWVQAHVPELWAALKEAVRAGGFGEPHLYICGLERMVKSVRDLARTELGVDRKHVHTERYD